MKVDYERSIIIKPSGKRTSARNIAFSDLHEYIDVFGKVVDVTTSEEAVSSWVASEYAEQEALLVLHSIVVLFGGGHRIWGKYHKQWQDDLSATNEILYETYKQRHESSADNLRATLKGIKGLGGLSYSTKMLRFLSPNHVVLDSILREEYAMTEADYDTFAGHCRKIGEILEVKPVEVESGLFTFVQLANPHQRSRQWKNFQHITTQNTF